MGIKLRGIALSIAGVYYIYPPCYAIPHNCYIAGCYTAIFEAKNTLTGAISAFIGKWAYSRGAIRNFHPDNVNGQGGQSVHFLENNAFSNANLASQGVIFTSESSGLIVL